MVTNVWRTGRPCPMFRAPRPRLRDTFLRHFDHRAVNSAYQGRFVVMGVCGAGKSIIGEALARAVGVEFVEGDRFHPAANVARMASGVALTDDDRREWLLALAGRLHDAARAGAGLVLSCSALRRAYRDLLRTGAPDARFIFLRGDRELLAARLSARVGHFMPPSLLDSQLATLEEPTPDEGAWVCDVADPVATIVAALVHRTSA